jgi:hypothetical protein
MDYFRYSKNDNNIQYIQKNGSPILLPKYTGKIIDIIPNLVNVGQTPISSAGIMEQRVNAWNSDNSKLAKQWGRHYFHSGDSIMYHRDGGVKVVIDSDKQKKVNSNIFSKGNHSQVLCEGVFDKTVGVEFSREEVEKFANKYLTQNEASKDPILMALARDDKNLLEEYSRQVYSRSIFPELMMVAIGAKNLKFEVEKYWCFKPVGVGGGGVGGYFSDLLSFDLGNVVGMIPETGTTVDFPQQSISEFNLEGLIGNIDKVDYYH